MKKMTKEDSSCTFTGKMIITHESKNTHIGPDGVEVITDTNKTVDIMEFDDVKVSIKAGMSMAKAYITYLLKKFGR